MRWQDDIYTGSDLAPKSCDATYLSFASELWESAPPRSSEEVYLEGVVESEVVCFAVDRAGTRLAVHWTGTVAIRLEDGRRVELEIEDDTLMSGGRRTSRREAWGTFRSAEPAVASLVPSMPRTAMLEVTRFVLAAGDEVSVCGASMGAPGTSGYRDAAHVDRLRVRWLRSHAYEIDPSGSEHEPTRSMVPLFVLVLVPLVFWAALLLRILWAAPSGGCGCG
ncbi:MAG: hypothetical protein JJ863_05960 [Deltaproteobacteria bacterium]|nr:hypothetical protein [Deltaproteobacteria bacterium]